MVDLFGKLVGKELSWNRKFEKHTRTWISCKPAHILSPEIM